LIDLFEALDKRGFNVELKIDQCGFKSLQLFLTVSRAVP